MDRSHNAARLAATADAIRDILRRLARLETKSQKALTLGGGNGNGNGGGDLILRATSTASTASGNFGPATLADGSTVSVFVWLSGTWGSGKKGYVVAVGGQFELISADC